MAARHWSRFIQRCIVLNDHRIEENPTGRARRGPFVRLARLCVARRAMLKTPSSKAIAR